MKNIKLTTISLPKVLLYFMIGAWIGNITLIILTIIITKWPLKQKPY